MARVRVSVPATVSSFGPGLDSIGLALRLYETIELEDAGSGFVVEPHGECPFAEAPALREQVVKAVRAFCRRTGRAPSGLRVGVSCERLPARGFGLDTGLLLGCAIAANVLCGGPLNRDELLDLAVRSGGSSPVASAALLGNLAVASAAGSRVLHTIVPVPAQEVVIIAPRSGLPGGPPPAEVGTRPHSAAALTALLVEALRGGDHALLREVAERLLEGHKAHPVFLAAAQAAHGEGASGVFVHEHGLSAVAFARSKHEGIAQAMADVFDAAQVRADVWIVPVETHGISIDAVDIPADDTHNPPVPASQHPIQF